MYGVQVRAHHALIDVLGLAHDGRAAGPPADGENGARDGPERGSALESVLPPRERRHVREDADVPLSELRQQSRLALRRARRVEAPDAPPAPHEVPHDSRPERPRASRDDDRSLHEGEL